MSNAKQSNKLISVVTYIIALVCLILGFVLPMYDGKNLLAMMLPNAFYQAFGLKFLENIGKVFTGEYTLFMFGKATTGFNGLAIAVSLYALITVIGIILLIPVLASKKTSSAATRCAAFIEGLAVLVLTAYALMQIELYVLSGAAKEFNWNLSVIGIALGGSLLMLIVQAFATKGSSGVIKFIIFLLSAIAVCSLLPITTLFKLKTTTLFGGKLAIGFTSQSDALFIFTMIFQTGEIGATIKEKLVYVFIAIVTILAIINFVLDVFGLGTKTRKSGLIFSLIRYCLQGIAAIAMIIVMYVFKKELLIEPGLLAYALLVATIIQIFFTAIRFTIAKAAAKKAVATPDAEPAAVAEPEPVFVAAPVEKEVKAQPAKKVTLPAKKSLDEEYAKAGVAASKMLSVPMVTENSPKSVYCGPTDSFIDKLENDEKIEFSDLFIEKKGPVYTNMPVYTVGGYNKDFFAYIFLYLGRFRPIISDGLMYKIFIEFNIYR